MTALPTGVRAQTRDRVPLYRPEGSTVTAGQTFAMGWLLARAAGTGTLQVVTEVAGLLPGGWADRDFYQAAVSGDRCLAEVGITSLDQSALAGDAFGDTDGPAPAYGVDNNTIGKLAVNPSSGAARSIIGLFLRQDPQAESGNGAIVWVGPEAVAIAQGLLSAQGLTTRDRVRGVITNLGGAVTYAAGVITGPANTAFPTQDTNISAPAVNDVYFAPKGLSNLPAASQAGPWQLLALGSGSSQYVLARPWWWKSGDPIPLCAESRVGPEGAAWAENTWRSFAAPGKVIDTDDPLFRPRIQRGTQALSGGAATVSNLWIASGAVPSLVDTTAANAVKGVTTAGDGSGSLALTGTSTDTIAYQYTNF